MKFAVLMYLPGGLLSSVVGFFACFLFRLLTNYFATCFWVLCVVFLFYNVFASVANYKILAYLCCLKSE